VPLWPEPSRLLVFHFVLWKRSFYLSLYKSLSRASHPLPRERGPFWRSPHRPKTLQNRWFENKNTENTIRQNCCLCHGRARPSKKHRKRPQQTQSDNSFCGHHQQPKGTEPQRTATNRTEPNGAGPTAATETDRANDRLMKRLRAHPFRELLNLP